MTISRIQMTPAAVLLVVAATAVAIYVAASAGTASIDESPLAALVENVVERAAPAAADDVALVQGSGGGGVAAEADSDPIPSDTPTEEAPPVEIVANAIVVEPDPDYEQALATARFRTAGWTIDFSLHTVPYSEIFGGGPPRDGIPSIDDPRFVTSEQSDPWLGGNEPVIFFELNGDVKAYPLQILTWHEIVNDEVGGVPVAVTFCPLCNSAVVFDRRLDGVVHRFGTSGNLRHSDLIMWDRGTESWWQQLTGEAIVGELTGKKLTFLAASIISYDDFKAAHPDGQVLSRETGYQRSYGSNPYAGYDRADTTPFLFFGDTDGRLLPKERVVTVSLRDVDAAFPLTILSEEGVINYTVNGRDLVVFFKSGTASALDARQIRDSRDVGATGEFDAVVDGIILTFHVDGDAIIDDQTGSEWNIVGRAIAGPMAGQTLTPIVHGDHPWFSWGAFKPDTLIYGVSG